MVIAVICIDWHGSKKFLCCGISGACSEFDNNRIKNWNQAVIVYNQSLKSDQKS